MRRGDVRRAKLYYLRGRTGKKARILEKAGTGAATAWEVSEAGLLDGAAAAGDGTAAPVPQAEKDAAAGRAKADAKAAKKAEAKAANEAAKAAKVAAKAEKKAEKRAEKKAAKEKEEAKA